VSSRVFFQNETGKEILCWMYETVENEIKYPLIRRSFYDVARCELSIKLQKV